MGRLCAIASFLALLVLATTGCGGGDDSEPQGKPKPGSNVPSGGKTVVAKVFEEPQRGIPADVGQWMVEIGIPQGEDPAFTIGRIVAPSGNTNFRLKNPQAVAHGLTVEEVGAGAEEMPAFGEGSKWMRVSLYPGKRYVFYCPVPGHREAGMEGTIEVDPELSAEDLKPF